MFRIRKFRPIYIYQQKDHTHKCTGLKDFVRFPRHKTEFFVGREQVHRKFCVKLDTLKSKTFGRKSFDKTLWTKNFWTLFREV